MFSNKKVWLFGGMAILGVAAIASAGFLGGLKLRQDNFRSQAQGQFFQMRGGFDGGRSKNDARFSGQGQKDGRMMERGNCNLENGQLGNRVNTMPGVQNGVGLGRTLEGKIVSKDDTSITIETDNGTKTITLADGVVMKKTISASVTDLSTDKQVIVSLERPINGDSLSAQTIQITN